MSKLNPNHWAEVKPGVILVPCWRGGSTSLLMAERLKQGVAFDPRTPHSNLHSPQHPDYAIRLREVPMDFEFVVVCREPVSRFESARAFLKSRPFVPTADWGTFIAWATHATDGHVIPMSRLIDRYFAGRPHRLVRIEDYAEWGPGLGLPAVLPRLHVSQNREPLPADLLPKVVDLYRTDYQQFNYPLP